MIRKENGSPSVLRRELGGDNVARHRHFDVVVYDHAVVFLVHSVEVMRTDLLDDEKLSSIDQYQLEIGREFVYVSNNHAHEIE